MEREAARREWYREQYLQADLLGEEPQRDLPADHAVDLQAA
jgi:hypothetical protein